MTLGKQFPLTEKVGLPFEAQFANLFNFTNLDVPNTRITDASFGVVSATQPVEQSRASRYPFVLACFLLIFLARFVRSLAFSNVS